MTPCKSPNGSTIGKSTLGRISAASRYHPIIQVAKRIPPAACSWTLSASAIFGVLAAILLGTYLLTVIDHVCVAQGRVVKGTSEAANACSDQCEHGEEDQVSTERADHEDERYEGEGEPVVS